MRHFFIVGAQRCGSTYLYSLLNEHPQIQMASPVRPEPKFFISHRSLNLDYDEYLFKYFKNISSNTSMLGEKSTSYLESISYAKNINNFFPDAKILIILRNPIHRAFSHYQFSVNNKLETFSFYDAFKNEKERKRSFLTSVNPFLYFSRGLYINYIKNYLQVFKKEDIKILILEHLAGNLNEIQKIYKWLGVSGSHIPLHINEKINKGKINFNCPAKFREELLIFYKDSIDELETLSNIDLALWKT